MALFIVVPIGDMEEMLWSEVSTYWGNSIEEVRNGIGVLPPSLRYDVYELTHVGSIQAATKLRWKKQVNNELLPME